MSVDPMRTVASYGETEKGEEDWVRTQITLPQVLPLEDGFTADHFFHTADGDVPLLLRFYSIDHPTEVLGHSQLPSGVLARKLSLVPDRAEVEAGAPGQILCTVVDALTPLTVGKLNDEVALADASPWEDSISRIVVGINEIIRLVSLCAGRRYEALSYEKLPSALVVFRGRVDQPDPWKTAWKPQLWLLEHQHPLNVRSLGPVGRVVRNMPAFSAELSEHSPLVLAMELHMDAESLLYQTQYRESLATAWSGFEVFLDAVISGIHWDRAQGKGPSHVTFPAEYRGKTTIAIAKSLLPQVIGGDWSSPKSEWMTVLDETYSLRNRVIHAGYTPSRAEVVAALRSILCCQAFIRYRLLIRRTAVPAFSDIVLKARSVHRQESVRSGGGRSGSAGMFAAWHRQWTAERTRQSR